MKTDKHLSKITLTRNQEYFVSCWFNMVHEHSLDSYRVRAMNPQNALRELVKCYEIGKPEERAAVRLETWLVLTRDLILKQAPFNKVTERIVPLLAARGPLEVNKEEGESKKLLFYFVAELQSLVKAAYIQSSIAYLKSLLCPPSDLPPSSTPSKDINPDKFDEIHIVTSYLLSTLIDRKASIESLYTLYAEILVPRAPKLNYNFSRRFNLVCALLTQPQSPHHVVLALENVTSPEKFPTLIGGISFSVNPPFSAADDQKKRNKASASKYLTPGPRILFASKTLNAQDPRSAGAEASEAVGQILNLVRFEYERSKVAMPDNFAFIQTNKAKATPRVFSLPAAVPNPTATMDGAGLASFVESVDELVIKGNFDHEGRDRVQSAFRLYRTGLDTNILENKFVNWWTAIEYLVRGTANGGSIGKSVEIMLTPVLCNAYIGKFLHALRSALLEIGSTIIDPVNNEIVSLRGMPIEQLYKLFKRTDIQPVVLNAVNNSVFARKQFLYLFAGLNNPNCLYQRNADHDQRLRWHLQRLWRARCDIVHSAERTANSALLCANLEYYLKITLMSLLKALRDVPTLSGPKEFFDRQAHTYQALQADLKNGNDDQLLIILST